jgi:endoglucanase
MGRCRHVNHPSLGCRSFFRFAGLAGSIVGVSCAYAGCLSAPSAASNDTPVAVKGCTVDGGAQPVTAPNGYYTSGGTVCTAAGAPHLFHGVDRPSLEWNPAGESLSQQDFALMASWGANVVRIALNQDFWLAGAALNNANYPAIVQQSVSWAESEGLDVILDLHWSDRGDLSVTSTGAQGAGNSNQQAMADTNSIEFWREVATTFKGDGRVLFELYNEPHNITWDVWLSGGPTGGFTAAGMQQLYDAVRGVGADNLVIAGGTSWAYDLSNVGPSSVFVHGYNVMYATHPYLTSGSVPSAWEGTFGRLETTDFAPVIATEFGDKTTPNCTGDWDRRLIQFADDHHMSWTAWAWFVSTGVPDDPQGCHFPSLIVDWTGTPSVQGVAVKAALATYPAPESRAGADAGAQSIDAGTQDTEGGGAQSIDAGTQDTEGGGAQGTDTGATQDPDAASLIEAATEDAAIDGGGDTSDDGSDGDRSDGLAAPIE